MNKTRKVKVIGAGGIGGHLVEPLARYLSYCEGNSEITVIDGDKFEDRNKERQRFVSCENKATHTVAQLKEQFPKIHFRAKGEYLTEDNVITSIREGDIIFMCVDNHATRKLVSDRCEELDNVTLISGGNDYTDGNVIVYRRENGNDLSKAPTKLYSKIANPEDKNPGKLTDEERQGCQREAQTNPQLLFANLAIASTMLNCYYACEQGKANFEQVYVDILTQRSRPAPERF
jgi:molybdopterin/thiamine biosynthesis adenylyltransferase